MKERTYLDYMDKTYLEELNYKIWSTKGARFQAHSRLSRMSRLSMICTSLLNAYLIAAGLLSVYSINNPGGLSDNIIAYLITSLSILLMVFSQVESSRQFDMKARSFHDCALALSLLYDELRIFKTLKTNPTEDEKIEFAKDLTSRYEGILSRNDNHLPIDFDIFRTKKPGYHLLKPWDVRYIKIKSYFQIAFIYHLLIVSPVLIGIAFYLVH